uniref:Septin 9b n=1 Tax=Oncorhynchus mykiss TaxID=8022 RepID=A0A8K9XWC9_ONCMY
VCMCLSHLTLHAALKRSFEVEDVDTSVNSSPGSRRAPNNTNHRPVMSPTSIYYRELGASNNNNGSISKTIMGGGSSKPPESISRGRTELSIDISSKQVDPTSPGSLRFGAKRPEVLGHSKTPEMGHKREVAFSKTPQEVVIRTGARTPEPPSQARRFEPLSLGDGPAVRTTPGISVTKAPETTGNGKNNHENHGSEVNPSHSNMSAPPHPQPPAKGASHGAGDFSYVGIDAILEQMRRKAMKQGFELNIMIVGQSGLGKSTLMNTLFKSKVSRKSVVSTPEERIPKTIEIKSISHDIEEKGVRMKLTVIDTPGFGDHINNENCWQPIMKFINDQYEQYLQEEINIDRKKRIPDSRVHCCMYFIPPTGHCLRPLDVEFMSRLSKVVNIVPVIAKADTLTLEERDFFKQTIREELRANGIDVYPQKEFDEDADDRMINDKIREMIPFAVVGSNQEYQVNGKRLLGRKTKWGTIEVENIAHCEFAYLRDLLIRTHMQNIKDITSSIHYEVYRVRRLNETNGQPNAQPPNTLVNPQQANGVAAQHQVLTHEM